MRPIIVPGVLQKNGIDWAFLENVKSLAEQCFKNPRYEEVYRLHNAWYNHVNNILGYIADFCTKSGLTLNGDESTIVIAASILHDIGKSLYLLHPDIKSGKYKDSENVLDNLEKSHSVISFLFIISLFDYDYRKEVLNIFDSGEEAAFKTVGNILEADFPLESTANSFILKAKLKEYLQCTAWISLRHKTLNDKLLHIFKPKLKAYLERVTNPMDDMTYEKKASDFFEKKIQGNLEIEEINKFLTGNKEKDVPDRFSVLSALLQLGDKLDISQKRLRMSHFYLEVLLDDMTDREVLRENLLPPKSMILWYRFYYTGDPTIESIHQANNIPLTKKTGVKITIPYFYPESIRNDFLYFRYKSEKDFEDLGILSILERTLQIEKNNEDFRIILERTENKKNGIPVRIVGLETRKERLICCLRKICKECLENSNKELEFDYVKNKIDGVLGKTVDPIPCRRNNTRSAISILKMMVRSARPTVSGMPLSHFTRSAIKRLRAKGMNWPKNFPLSPFMPVTTHFFIKKIAALGLDISKECPLVQQIIKIFDKDIVQLGYPGWEKYSFKLPGNIRRLVCRNCKRIASKEDKIQEYVVELEKERVMLSFSRQAEDGVKQWKAAAAEDRKKLPAGTIFYPPKSNPQLIQESSTRFIPVSLDIAYLLNLFRHLREESLAVDDIANISGLDRGRILKYCGWLEHENFLLLDDRAETYKINLEPTKYSIVEKVLKEFDSRRSELVSKIRDIDRFGKPLALFAGLNEKRLQTNIKGLDLILSPFALDLEGLPLRKSILLVGPPGSGKTTLSLEIVRQIRLQKLPCETALYLTFEGDIQQLAEDNSPFGWNYSDISACVRSLSTLQSPTYLNDPDKFFKRFLNILDEFSPDLVAVDNLGYFLQLAPPDVSRKILNRLIRVLTVRGITSLLIGEDFPGGTRFELYDTDGVICLHYKEGKREIEITKMRGREFAGGRHPFKIKSISDEDKKKLGELG